MRKNKTRNWLRTFAILFFVAWFLFAFRLEILSILQLIYSVIRTLVGMPIPFPQAGQVFRALILLCTGFFTFFAASWISLYILAQFVLPVRTPEERSKVFERMSNFIFRYHGPALFIKEGKVVGTQAETHRWLPGIVFVDHCSAIVLERQPSQSVMSYWRRRLRSSLRRSHEQPGPMVRVAGPGIVFTRGAEKLRGAVDLRPQTRRAESVIAHTRDGIPVETAVHTAFTLGEDPEIIFVTANPDRSSKILVVRCEPSGQGLRILDLVDELDPADQAEIYFRVQEMTKTEDFDDRHVPQRLIMDQSPYYVSETRVHNAIYSAEARQMPDNTREEWSSLPVQVAVATFRNMLATHQYDHLYLPDDPEEYPIHQIKRAFARAVVYQGILAYQYVERLNGMPFDFSQANGGHRPLEVDDDELLFYPVQELKNPKPLRNRGIKVLHAGFSDLRPTSQTVREQFMNTWKARWQSEAEITRADFELQAMRIKNRAKVQAQQEMAYTLSRIFQMPSYSQEALAMRVFQALETAATEPSTHQLLPQDTINLLFTLRHVMLPEGGPKISSDIPPKPASPEQKDGKENQNG